MEIFCTKDFDANYFTSEFLILFHKMSKFDMKSGKRRREKVMAKQRLQRQRRWPTGA